MSDLPSGTVTFLFTDIEGSTQRWEHDRTAMHAAVERHLAILGETVTAHAGVLFKTVGDAVQAAFPRAPSAVAAALEAQRALLSADWSGIDGLRVRMALHTGEAVPDARGDYLAAPLNRLSRLLSTGYGGQVLLSQTVQQLLRGGLPPDCSLLDLGEHRFRDLLEPERVFQLLHPALPPEFPALRSLDAHPTNLPRQPTPFLGREREVAEVMALLRNEDIQLVTLTGSGGTGKTRLALHAAAELLDDFADGVFFVDLAPLTNPDLVSSAIAATLGVRQEGAQPLSQGIETFLHDKQVLLLLDNFEHLVAGAAMVSDLLRACPRVKVLATSRAPLHLRAEQEAPIPPLALPDLTRDESPELLAQSEAVRLFVARAVAAKPDFTLDASNGQAIAQICHRLDGLPLAIELAAARIKLLPPAALLTRLEHRLPLLTGGARDAPQRQRTLRDTIGWSHDLLSSTEQMLFRRLAVFSGGWTLDAAEAVANHDGALDVLGGLVALVDMSLVRQSERPHGDPRFVMLETIREFALEQLATSDDAEVMRRTHARYCVDLAERLRPQIEGPEGAETLHRFEAEHGNVRSALTWAVERSDVESMLRLVAALWKFWWVRNHLTEGRDWSERALALGGHWPSLRLEVMYAAGSFARRQGDLSRAGALGEEGSALATAAGDDLHAAMLLFLLGLVADDQDDLGTARTRLEEAVAHFRALPPTHWLASHGIAIALDTLGDFATRQGDLAAAVPALEEALTIWRQRGDAWGMALVLTDLGNLAVRRGDAGAATQHYRDGLARYWEVGDNGGIGRCLESLAWLAAHEKPEQAARLLAAAEVVRDEVGDTLGEDRERHEETISVACAALGKRRFAAAWQEGRAMPLEEIVTEFLSEAHGIPENSRLTHGSATSP